MAKQITPAELAEIVAGLLMVPGLLGELDSPDKHQAFMHDIGQVVADHCGGAVNQVNPPETVEKYLSEDESSPSLSVSPNESLPSLNRNVWACYDPTGWEGEVLDCVEAGSMLGEDEVLRIRSSILYMLSVSIKCVTGIGAHRGLEDSTEAYLNAVDALSFNLYGKAAVDLVENTDAAIQSLQDSFANDVVLPEALQAVRLLQAKEVWVAFGSVPVDDDNQIKVPFLSFPAGIKCIDICQYIEQEFDCSVATDLMPMGIGINHSIHP